MAVRSIIEINEKKCNGCGVCIPGCPEGALQVIDGKARLVSDLFCDGLGACIKKCPRNAMKVIEREAIKYDEKKVMANIVKHGTNTIIAHLRHLDEHGETKLIKEAIGYLEENDFDVPDFKKKKDDCGCGSKTNNTKNINNKEHSHGHSGGGCPSSKIMQFGNEESDEDCDDENVKTKNKSSLTQWPIQSNLVPPHAPFLDGCHLLVCADCVPFTYANFHSELLHGKKLIISCPKFDDMEKYIQKMTAIFTENKIKSVTVAIMEVPCCSALHMGIEEAIKRSKKNIPLIVETISIRGELM